MKITINGVDYTGSLDAMHPLTIERRLNEPTVCQFWLSLPSQGGLAAPMRNSAVAIAGDDATSYFTGYVVSAPAPEYAGLGITGPRYRLAVRAMSDELLLDQVSAAPVNAAGMTAAQLMNSLVNHTRSTALAAGAISVQAPVSSFAAAPAAKWSESAGQIASLVRAAYRALAGVLQLSEIPATIHQLDETDGSLNLAALTLNSGAGREFANDITVCGEHEPVAYVTEYFLGDGVTAQFNLGARPYFPPASRATLIDERFDQPGIDLSVWDNSGGAGFLSLGPGGLTMNGGNGIDGQTTLSWIDSIELGGTLVVEASGVRLATGSSGVLAGLYVGSSAVSGCVAGFQVTAQPGTGAISVQPIVAGEGAGMAYPLNPANLYTMRVRLHCPECERALATYRTFGDGGAITYGGQTNQASARVLFEIQECVNGVAGMPVILCDGTVSSLPPACSVVAASLISMIGSMRAFRITSQGPACVVSSPAGGDPYTRRVGSVAQGGECSLDSAGRLLFNPGFVPVSGERIAISYRSVGRSVGRAINAPSQQALAASGLPPVSQWTGSVANPPARSSADCRNAAAALVSASAGYCALWSGSYKCSSAVVGSDIWPGDALSLHAPSLDLDSQVVVRSVKLAYTSTYPDIVAYEISFANDWASDLAIRTSNAVPDDAWLPAPISPAVLPNLANLTVSSLTDSSITINTGVPAPPGGGFEIRRRDFAFMPGEDSDLVMRGSQQTMTLSRESAGDHFYVRMYDGATPPSYSEFSTALFINLPVDREL